MICILSHVSFLSDLLCIYTGMCTQVIDNMHKLYKIYVYMYVYYTRMYI